MASTAEVESTTRDVIDEFCRYGMLFTALDVSNEVKTRITGVRHREVSPVVRAIFEADDMSGYTRTTIDVDIGGGRKAQAFLYHEPGRDPSEYGQHERSQQAAKPVLAGGGSASSGGASDGPKTQSSGSSAAAPKPAPKPVVAVADPGGSELDLAVLGDGSAHIPRSFMVRAGIITDEVALDTAGFGAGLRLMEKDEDEDEDPLDVLEYERGDLLRIPGAFLSGFGAGAKLRVRAEIGVVFIEAV